MQLAPRRFWTLAKSFRDLLFVITCAAICSGGPGNQTTISGGERKQQREAKATQIAKKIDDQTRSGTTAPTAPAENHPLLPVLKIAHESEAAVKQVKDYSAVFNKRERIQGNLLSHTMEIKLREQDFGVYIRYVKPHSGREVIYVAGRNQDKLLVHEEGLKSIAGTIQLLPTSKDALAESRYPITELGISKLLSLVIAQWEQELAFGEVNVQLFNDAKLGDVPCRVIETSHPESRANFKFHKTRLYIEKSSKLPIRIEQYGWAERPGSEAPLIEEYTYSKLNVNPGLTDRDFDVKNPAYRF